MSGRSVAWSLSLILSVAVGCETGSSGGGAGDQSPPRDLSAAADGGGGGADLASVDGGSAMADMTAAVDLAQDLASGADGDLTYSVERPGNVDRVSISIHPSRCSFINLR